MSSSGHVLLLERLLHNFNSHLVHWQNDFALSHVAFDALDHLLHAPTVFILCIFFFKRWFFLLKNIQCYWHTVIRILVFTACADGVTVLFFLFFKIWFHFLFPLSAGFFVTSFLLCSLFWCTKKTYVPFKLSHSFVLGAVQGIALLPGISRFASVYVCSRWLGLRPAKAFEVTFLIQLPLITAASLHAAWVFIRQDQPIQLFSFNVLCIVLGASIIAYALLWYMYKLAKKNKLWLFGVYMIVPFILSLIL